MVDYSKWNSMDVSDSEREESEEDFGPPSPKVTRFNTEQQVTFGGGRSEIQVGPSPSGGAVATSSGGGRPSAAASSAAGASLTAASTPSPTSAASITSASTTSSIFDQARSAIEWNRALEADWTRNGGYYEPPSACASPSPSSCPGREQEDLTGCVVPYYWSQNQREVFVRL